MQTPEHGTPVDGLNAGDGKEEAHMEYTKLGNTGMDVSRICLGCMGFGDAESGFHKWVLGEEDSRPVIQKALELGINFFDTANAMYRTKIESPCGSPPG